MAAADPYGAEQNCPIKPEVDCIEAIPGQGYKAHFNIKNYNTRDATIPTGNGSEGRNRFTEGIGANQGQPTEFPKWPGQLTYALMWDGSATQWQLGLPDNISRAPEGDRLDLAYYDVRDNRCENVPVTPHVSCTYNNNDGTVTAYFGYESERPGITEIPLNVQQGGRNELAPLPPLLMYTSLVTTELPTMFMQGKFDGVFKATWDTSEGDSLFWWLYYGEENVAASVEAYAPDGDITRECAAVTPTACIKQTLDGNENGYLTAHFGYANDNNFEIDIALGALNEVVGGNTAPDPSIPETFEPGGKDVNTHPVFSVEFNDEDAVDWTVAGVSETADMNTALCEKNELPTCSIFGQTGLNCGGETTATTLTAEGVDPEGRNVSFIWTITCGEEGSNFTQTVSGENGETLDLTLLDPGTGVVVEPGTCTVELSVSDDFGAETCFVELASTACDLDCAGEPYAQGQDPANVEDQCGECLPEGDPSADTTCQDCAGTPNGAALLDTAGACCLVNELDACGICNGNNDSCLDCVETDSSQEIVDLESMSNDFLATTRRGLRQLRRKAIEVGRRVPRKFIRRTRSAAKSLATQTSAAALSIPATTQSCGNRDLCVSTSNDGLVTNVTTLATQFHDLIYSISRKLKRKLRGTRTGTRLELLADAYLEDALDNASALPKSSDSCNL